jgi:hypothetical protein
MILICNAPSSTVCYLNARSQSLLPDRPSDPVTPRTLGSPALAQKILIALQGISIRGNGAGCSAWRSGDKTTRLGPLDNSI